MNFEHIINILKNNNSKSYGISSIVYSQGDIPHSIYFLKKGTIALSHTTESGKKIGLRVFKENQFFGHRSFLAEEKYHGSAVAMIESEVITISKHQYETLCTNNPSLIKDILKLVSKDLGQAELRLMKQVEKSANVRIANTLAYLKLNFPNIIWSRKNIAEHSLSSHETVARLMSKLEEENIIKKVKRDFEIIDYKKLMNLPKELI